MTHDLPPATAPKSGITNQNQIIEKGPSPQAANRAPNSNGVFESYEDLLNARLFILDDEPMNVLLLERVFAQAGFNNIQSCIDPVQALESCRNAPPDLLLLDLMMPQMDGFTLIEKLCGEWQESVPILVLTADISRNSCRRALSLGAQDFLTKPFDQLEVLLRARNLLQTFFLQRELRTTNAQLESRVSERTRALESANMELESAQLEAMQKLALAAEFRDDDTGEHTRRVGATTALLADSMGLDSQDVARIQQAAPLHDVGKIAVPDAILLKPGKLSPEEFAVMQTHAASGAELLSRSRSPLMQVAENIARSHHERWDGSGYPLKLRQDEIPLEGRLTAVADVFDALTHERPYKRAWPIKEALEAICAGAGTQFDPTIVEAFMTLPHEALI